MSLETAVVKSPEKAVLPVAEKAVVVPPETSAKPATKAAKVSTEIVPVWGKEK